MGYYSSTKRNVFEPLLMSWKKFDPIIQNEVSQKNRYHILTHILESRQMVLMNLFAGQQ